ncbi:hypothetical protein ACMA1I_17195 [Pontibacter sp. 13R65]|uniref:hypothetical protein n=1 Tax=Pontibacter sp. 13R65 TaxID=3127458 RepID=UPI00301CAB86
MKILCFAFVLFFSITTASVAQDAPKSLSPETAKQCLELTRLMAKNLYLYDAEYLKLKTLNEKTMLTVQEIYSQYQNAPTLQEAKLKEATSEFKNELVKILDKQQQVAFANYPINASLWLDTPQAIKAMTRAGLEK